MNKYMLLISWVIAVAAASVISVYPIGTANQAEISAMFSTMITPATYTFSIWSVIYASWIALGVYFFIKWNFVKNTNLKLLAWAQILSSLWLLPSQFEYIPLSFLVMLGVLGLLFQVFFNSRDEEQYFKFVVELFLGWIIVASLANFHQTLVALDIYVFPIVFTVISIVWGLLLNIYLIKRYAAFIPAGVFIWAGIWIILGQENTITQITTGLSILTLILVVIQTTLSSQK